MSIRPVIVGRVGILSEGSSSDIDEQLGLRGIDHEVERVGREGDLPHALEGLPVGEERIGERPYEDAAVGKRRESAARCRSQHVPDRSHRIVETEAPAESRRQCRMRTCAGIDVIVASSTLGYCAHRRVGPVEERRVFRGRDRHLADAVVVVELEVAVDTLVGRTEREVRDVREVLDAADRLDLMVFVEEDERFRLRGCDAEAVPCQFHEADLGDVMGVAHHVERSEPRKERCGLVDDEHPGCPEGRKEQRRRCWR